MAARKLFEDLARCGDDEDGGEHRKYGDDKAEHGAAIGFFRISHGFFLTVRDIRVQTP